MDNAGVIGFGDFTSLRVQSIVEFLFGLWIVEWSIMRQTCFNICNTPRPKLYFIACHSHIDQAGFYRNCKPRSTTKCSITIPRSKSSFSEMMKSSHIVSELSDTGAALCEVRSPWEWPWKPIRLLDLSSLASPPDNVTSKRNESSSLQNDISKAPAKVLDPYHTRAAIIVLDQWAFKMRMRKVCTTTYVQVPQTSSLLSQQYP